MFYLVNIHPKVTSGQEWPVRNAPLDIKAITNVHKCRGL